MTMLCPNCTAEMKHVDRKFPNKVLQEWWCPMCHQRENIVVPLPVPLSKING